MPRRRVSRNAQKRIASSRISGLLQLAEQNYLSEPERSTRYVEIARSISTRCKVRIPHGWRVRICRRCKALLSPGRTSRTRLRGNHINVTCTKCGKVHRYPYKKRAT